MKSKIIVIMFVLFGIIGFIGCSSVDRGLSSFTAENFGGDWVIVQYDYTLTPKNCWQLKDVSVVNEPQSDGIYWKDTESGHLVHISGWYNRVQVNTEKKVTKQAKPGFMSTTQKTVQYSGTTFAEAGKLLGVDINQCGNGVYPFPNK